MTRLLHRPRVRRPSPTGDDASSLDSAGRMHSILTDQNTGASFSSPPLFSRMNFVILATGIALGYLVLPFLLVQYVGFDDIIQRHSYYRYDNDPRFSDPSFQSISSLASQQQRHERQSLSASRRHDGIGTSAVHASSVRAAETLRRRSIRDSNKDTDEPTSLNNADKMDNSGYSETEVGGEGAATEIEHLLLAQFKLLSSQSIATPTTPYIMHTKKLADRDRKKILVTGGTGFVGSHLVDRLMTEGHEVIALDNFFTGSRKNVEHWMNHPYFSLVVHDVINPILLEVDQIYHLACPASPPHYQYNPVKTIKTSTMGTINMLGLAKRVKARVLLASTSEIYGDPKEHPQKESYWGNVNTIGPRSCYDEGKRVAETMMYSYRDQSDVSVRVARIFNTFGPRMHPNDGRVVSNFIIQSLQNRELTVYGKGDQTRSFQYVSDLVEGLYQLMNGEYDLPVNLGNPDEYSVKQFAEYIRDLTKSSSKIQFLEAQRDDPSQRRPDITTAKEQLGWQPQVSVKDGLAKTIDYFRRVLKEEGTIVPTGPEAVKPVA